MNSPSPDFVVEPDPYRRLFSQEYAQLDRVRDLVSNTYADREALTAEISKMAASYESLIRQAIRLTRAGDRIGRHLNASRKELERKNRILIDQAAVRDELISVTAHDLQNPLSAIVGLTEILRDEVGPLSETPADNYLTDIEESARHLLCLVNDLLAMSRLEQGTLEFRSEICVLDEIVDMLSPQYSLLAERKGIRLITGKGPRSYPVCADPSALRRVLENLISNAVKYCSRGCTIKIVTDYSDPGRARVSVSDDGPGIRESDQANLFQPYGLTRNRPTGGEMSTGLGLSIAKLLIDGMGGRIWCVSEEGQGSAFHLEAPRFHERDE